MIYVLAGVGLAVVAYFLIRGIVTTKRSNIVDIDTEK